MQQLHPSANPQYTRLTITGIREEIPGVKTFTLQPSTPLSYKPGQFLTFIFDSPQGEDRRSYSLSSAGLPGEPLSITLKRVSNGKYSRPLIDHASVGDILTATAATGQFVLPEDLHRFRQIFFFAAGIGITPVFSLIKALLYHHSDKDVILIYSNTGLSTTVFYEELLTLHKQHGERFRLEFLFSSTPDLTKARLSKWLLPRLLEVYATAPAATQLFYTCGPFPYMRMVTLALEEAGYGQDQIKKEQFDVSRPRPQILPPDQAPHEVSIVLPHRQARFIVQYPETILGAARKAGIDIPFSCETGRCGSCLMQCTSGETWMSNNEVLTDKEVAAGKVLTCVAFPIGGDVALTK